MNESTVLTLDRVEGHFFAQDTEWAKWASETLMKAYPGHPWAVNCSWETGMMSIINMELSGTHGYQLHLRGSQGVYSASELADRVKRAGGEILERFGVSRGKLNDDEMNHMLLDQYGMAIGDYS